MFALLITDSDGETHIHSLTAGDGHYYTLGRADDCDISLPHEMHISRVHCILYIDGFRVFLQDNQSSNGIHIGSRQVTAEYMVPEREYTLGRCTMVLICTQEVPESASPRELTEESGVDNFETRLPFIPGSSTEDAPTQAFHRPE